MGGDVAGALAGVDLRVARAGAFAGSPDWTDAVPAVGAEEFGRAVRAEAASLDVDVIVHPGLTHRGVCGDEAVLAGVIDWLATHR